MKLVTNGFAPLYENVRTKKKLRDCPEGTVFVCEDDRTDTEYLFVIRDLGMGQILSGWMYAGYLDEYRENLSRNVVTIDNATLDPNDAWQYADWFGKKQINLCGQICAARVLNFDLGDILAEWQQDEPNIFANVFKLFSSKIARGTGIPDLQNLFSVFDKTAVPLSDLFKDANIPSRTKNSPYMPTKTKSIVDNYHVIAGCKINNNTGVLQSSGILHWVVLESVHLERWKMGAVGIYNPFMNSIEYYSWREWIASAGYPYGVAVEK